MVESYLGSYWVSTEAVTPIIAIKALQPTNVSQENVTMVSTPHAGEFFVITSSAWSPAMPFGSAHSHCDSRGQELSLIQPELLV